MSLPAFLQAHFSAVHPFSGFHAYIIAIFPYTTPLSPHPGSYAARRRGWERGACCRDDMGRKPLIQLEDGLLRNFLLFE